MAEVEAKFLLRRPEQAEQALAVLRELGFISTEVGTKTHVDTYFDTADFAILRAGWTYRCRQRDGHNTLNLKACGTQDGNVFVRQEIDQPLADFTAPDSTELPPGPVQERLTRIVDGQPRHKLFSVTSRRRVYVLSRPGDNAVRLELDLDQTRILATRRNKRAPGAFAFSELELEHESGDTGVMSEVAAALRDRARLVPSQYSKFDRGVQAAGLSVADKVQKHRESELAAADSFLDLLYRHLQFYFDRMLEYQPLALEGLHPEGVHRMRVSIRHFRALLRIYTDIFAARDGVALDNELRWLSAQLGRARDADVCEMAIRDFNAALPPDAAAAAAPYESHVRETTVTAYMHLADVFAGPRYAGLLEWMQKFISAGPDSETRQRLGHLSISDAADRDVHPAAKKMLKRGRNITAQSPERRWHKLRIQAKRMRYLVDFFAVAELMRWQPSVKALGQLQDLLGEQQDAITALERLEDYLNALPDEDKSLDLRLAIDHLMAAEQQRIVDCRKRFPAFWSRFRNALAESEMLIVRDN
jgi:inorganic triphosphatase YgiF